MRQRSSLGGWSGLSLGVGLSVFVVGCDRVKEGVNRGYQAAVKVQEKAEGGVSGLSGLAAYEAICADGEVDERWRVLVDREGEGEQFRKDLDFPEGVSVVRTDHHEFTPGNWIFPDAMGRGGRGAASVILGAAQKMTLRRKDGVLTMGVELAGEPTLHRADVAAKVTDQGGKQPVALDAELDQKMRSVWGVTHPASRMERQSVNLYYDGERWQPGRGLSGDLQRLAWAKSVAPVVPEVLVEAGLHPRPRWFSAHYRWQAGQKMTLRDQQIGLFADGEVEGEVELVYRGPVVVHGHPCGEFSVTGDVRWKDRYDEFGVKRRGAMRVTAGRLACSLVYPVVLGEYYESVVTMDYYSAGAVAARVSGAYRLVRVKEWQPLDG